MKSFVLPHPEFSFHWEVDPETSQKIKLPQIATYNRAYVRNDTDYYLYFYRRVRGKYRMFDYVENGIHQLLQLPQPATPFENLLIYREPAYLSNSPNLIKIDFGHSGLAFEQDDRFSRMAKYFRLLKEGEV